MMIPQSRSVLSLEQAAHLMVESARSANLHDAEVSLALAIQRGELHANIKRWATEQWEGRQLPGNINRLETWIEAEALQAWWGRQ
ncbi:hypothetical protein [Parazoarcus communis]|nr:hypothetical protein [Parazoarcus communis]